MSRAHKLLLGSLAFLLAIPFVFANRPALADANYSAEADAAAAQLQTLYNTQYGQWSDAEWWQQANTLETVLDYQIATGNTSYQADIANTFDKNNYGNFLNGYYDDEGWWALAWTKAYDVTGDGRYLSMAQTIFADMANGWSPEFCGGGIWWDKPHSYKNAIANELFLAVAARLALRGGGSANGTSYVDWANQEWTWFSNSGMINSNNLVNDGLNNNCQNNGWYPGTYNQGVILGGLIDLAQLDNNSGLVSRAEAIASANNAFNVTGSGVLYEGNCEPGDNCGADGPQFKGVYIRNLARLYSVDNRQDYANFIQTSADSVWANDRDGNNNIGLHWAGPFIYGGARTQNPGLSALTAAIPFNNNLSNVAAGKSATASGSSCSGGYADGPSSAVDNNFGTKWCEGGPGAHSLTVDLGGTFNITKFTVYHAGSAGEGAQFNDRDFTISLSTDGSNWNTVVTVQGNTANITSHPINSTTASFARITVTADNNNDTVARIYEFQVFGS